MNCINFYKYNDHNDNVTNRFNFATQIIFNFNKDNLLQTILFDENHKLNLFFNNIIITIKNILKRNKHLVNSSPNLNKLFDMPFEIIVFIFGEAEILSHEDNENIEDYEL